MRILVDAMGGDNAPDQIALGAIQAAKDFGCETVLVGRGEAILQALKDQGIETLPKGVEIANADDVVDMHDDPATVVKKKKDSSMVVGLTMLKEGGGDAFVSAGSTGALLSAATLIVRRVKGIRRAAMGPQIPTKTGRECVLIDCGATADCTPEFLLQFAFMGSYYAAEFAEVQLAVFHHDGDVPADDGRAQVRVGVVAAKVVFADGLGKVQRLAAGMQIHALIPAGGDPLLKDVDQILLQRLQTRHGHVERAFLRDDGAGGVV